MLTKDNLVLTRSEPLGSGGTQFLYRVKNYGLIATSKPQEEISQIHWEVDVVKYKNEKLTHYEVCHTTELAGKTLVFHNDKSLNEFLLRSFIYFNELNLLDAMLPESA